MFFTKRPVKTGGHGRAWRWATGIAKRRRYEGTGAESEDESSTPPRGRPPARGRGPRVTNTLFCGAGGFLSSSLSFSLSLWVYACHCSSLPHGFGRTIVRLHFFFLSSSHLLSSHFSRLYRLARPRARLYQLRGLPLVGSECGCPQCNSSFVITRGSAMPSTMDLPVRISRPQKLKRNANHDSGTP